MSFGEAIATCFRKYITFSGRASRAEYWWFYLFYVLVAIVAAILDAVAFGATDSDETGPIGAVVGLVLFIPIISATWRRLHDTGRPGYYFFFPLLTIAIGFVVMSVIGPDASVAMFGVTVAIMLSGLAIQFWWLVKRGDPFDNQYGPGPNSTVGVFE